MSISCVWEHNGNDTLLYCVDFPGAYSRGADLQEALSKLPVEIRTYCQWAGWNIPDDLSIHIVQDTACDLRVSDADSDVIFDYEKLPLTLEEYQNLKYLALKSAEDFLSLYKSIPDPRIVLYSPRKTFYGNVPSSAEEMYMHTKNVNAYYFGEIGVDADNDGDIYACRLRGFEKLEALSHFLNNQVIEGSYGEHWSLRKMLRRFLWHDRIHARAMYRRSCTLFPDSQIPNVFFF